MKNKRIYYGVLITVLSLFIISLIFNDNLWGDEAFTMLTLKGNFKDIINTTARDVHPPLYYLIAKIFVLIFGYSVPAVKIASVIPIILTMILGATLLDKYFGEKSPLIPTLFILLMAFAPNFLHMSYELRMYSWGLFFVSFSALAAYGIYLEGFTLKNSSLFIIVSLCAAYTHYFSLVSVGIIYLMLFVALLFKSIKYLKECIIISIITIVGYLPWFFIFLKQLNSVSSNYWIPDIKFGTIIGYIKYPFNNELININFIICIMAIISLIINIYTDKKNRKESIFALMCISLFFLTVGLGVVLSLIIRPIFVIRYAFPTTALLWLGILIGLKQLLHNKIHCILLASIIFLNGFYSYDFNYNKEYNKGVDQVKSYINKNAKESNVFITNNTHFNWTILKYYFPNNKVYLSKEFDFTNMKKDQTIYHFSNSSAIGIDKNILSKNNIEYKLELSSNIDNNKAYIFKLTKTK